MKREKASRTWHEQAGSVPLDADSVAAIWSKTYNREGKPDWSHILPYYDENVVFQDTVQRIEGKRDFVAMCNRLTRRCDQLNMDISDVVKNGPDIYFRWRMVTVFRRLPSTPVFGCTKLTLNDKGKIISQRDYYDLWGDIFNGIPGWRRIYRRALTRFFG